MRTRVAAALDRLGFEVIPSHANFLMTRLRDGSSEMTEALVQSLFDEGGFVVNRTREAGLEEFFRFSLSTPTLNDRLIACVRGFLG